MHWLFAHHSWEVQGHTLLAGKTLLLEHPANLEKRRMLSKTIGAYSMTQDLGLANVLEPKVLFTSSNANYKSGG